jgi:hypothetical protein
VLATNLLVRLARKQYSAELNVFSNFTSKSASVMVGTNVAEDKLPPPASKTAITATHQSTRTTVCGKTRITGETHFSINQHRLTSLFQFPECVRHDCCRRSPPPVAVASLLLAMGWALPARVPSQEYGDPQEIGRGRRIHICVRTVSFFIQAVELCFSMLLPLDSNPESRLEIFCHRKPCPRF